MSDFQGLEDLLQDFLVEAGDLLSGVDNKLVDLEKTPHERGLLNEIFRGFHTIKGGAGFLNAKGSAVIGKPFIDDYTTKFQDAQSQIRDSLQNDNQRRQFDQHAEVQGLLFKSSLLQHQAKGTIAFNQQARNDTMALGFNDIAAHPYDDATYQTNIKQMSPLIVQAG